MLNLSSDSLLKNVVCVLQVLANVAATSIPQLSGQQQHQQMVAMQAQDGTEQMVAVSGAQPIASLSAPGTQMVAQSAVAQEGGDAQNLVLGQVGTNPFQTVTIMSADGNQQGEAVRALCHLFSKEENDGWEAP